MDLLADTIALAKLARVTEEDIRSLGLSWRWYLKVRDGDIGNPGVKHVLALNELAKRKLSTDGKKRTRKAA